MEVSILDACVDLEPALGKKRTVYSLRPNDAKRSDTITWLTIVIPEEDNRQKGSCFRLNAECTVREASELRQQLIAHLGAEQPLLLDGSDVERIDSAGVQLLVAFSLDCMERSIDFAWSGRSQELDHAIDLLGVTPLTESPGAAPPASTANQAKKIDKESPE